MENYYTIKTLYLVDSSITIEEGDYITIETFECNKFNMVEVSVVGDDYMDIIDSEYELEAKIPYDKIKTITRVAERIKMNKTCEKCYWETICKKDKTNVCDDFSYECVGGSESVLPFEKTPVCEECALKETDIEESTQTHYHLDGEYLGSDNDDLAELISDVDDRFTVIKEG